MEKIVIMVEIPTYLVEPYMHRTAYIVSEMEKAKRTMEQDGPLSPAEQEFIEFDINVGKSICNQCAVYVDIKNQKEEIEKEQSIPLNVINEVNDIIANMKKS